MSLDVYLEGPARPQMCRCHCGHEHPIEVTGVYSANITHNLGAMAKDAGIYVALWKPEELGIATARELIPLLRDGVELLESDPERFQAFNSPNGWGRYEHFVRFVRAYLEACRDYPDAIVRVSR